MNTLKKSKIEDGIVLSVILLLSFALWLVIPYAQHLAYGRDILWNYLVIKGIIVSFTCAVLYLLAGKYGAALYEKYSKPILHIGTALLLLFTILKHPLSQVEVPVLAKTIAYAYAALPFLKIVTLCAMVTCLNEIMSGSFSLQRAALIFASVVLIFVLDNVLKAVILIFLVCVLIRYIKEKKEKNKVTIIVLSVICACVFLFLADEWISALLIFSSNFHDPTYMTYYSKIVWSQAKLFGTMDELKSCAGDITDFSLLWLIGFIGIIPTLLIVILLVFLVGWILKKHRTVSAVSISTFAIIYLIVRTVLAVLTNCGIFFNGFMTPVPIIFDTVSGMLCVFWLLGINDDVIDIKSNASGEAGRLSNFTERRFIFDNIECNSIEGVLQSFKCPNIERQKEICLLYGKAAKVAGQEFDWTVNQILYWNGTEYPRKGEEYQTLLDRLYDAVYEQDEQFRADLQFIKDKKVDHKIGLADKSKTVLTRCEFVQRLRRLSESD